MTIENIIDLVPARLQPKKHRIFLEGLELLADIGFHDFEIGVRQRLIVNIEVWLEERYFAHDDQVASAWNYDNLRDEVSRLVQDRRYNLQETLVRALYDAIAARAGVIGLKVSTHKPDVYPDCRAVGVELSSF